MRGELLDKFGIFICDLQVSSLILFKEQSKPGRCIVAYKDHVSEMIDISEETFASKDANEEFCSGKPSCVRVPDSGRNAPAFLPPGYNRRP